MDEMVRLGIREGLRLVFASPIILGRVNGLGERVPRSRLRDDECLCLLPRGGCETCKHRTTAFGTVLTLHMFY